MIKNKTQNHSMKQSHFIEHCNGNPLKRDLGSWSKEEENVPDGKDEEEMGQERWPKE